MASPSIPFSTNSVQKELFQKKFNQKRINFWNYSLCANLGWIAIILGKKSKMTSLISIARESMNVHQSQK